LAQINADESAAVKLMAEMTEKLKAAKAKKETLKQKFLAFEQSQEAPLKAARQKLEVAQQQKQQFGWVPFTNYDADIKSAAVGILNIITGAASSTRIAPLPVAAARP
jgi:hypothetical protein